VIEVKNIQMLAARRPPIAVATSKTVSRIIIGSSSSSPHVVEQRRTFLGISKALDKRLYRMAKGVMPAISKTEQIALGCGTIGFDRDIFTGNPSLQHLNKTYQPKLSPEEHSFINNEVNTLCGMLNDHEVARTKDFTKEAWDYMRDKGFFALKIPKEWGGKEFSTHAVSQVLVKLATHCFDANATVAVPNSLGPG
jgi:acyl-CoA dehydrogenase